MPNLQKNKILIIDFGSQYTQLIARRVREIGVYCELVPFDISSHFIENFNPSGIILSWNMLWYANNGCSAWGEGQKF